VRQCLEHFGADLVRFLETWLEELACELEALLVRIKVAKLDGLRPGSRCDDEFEVV